VIASVSGQRSYRRDLVGLTVEIATDIIQR
jgi:hypothetical protein